MIKISEVQITFVRPKDGHIGFASLVIDDSLYLDGIAIHTSPLRSSGYRLVFPVKKIKHNFGHDQLIPIFKPISAEAGLIIERAIADKIEEINDDKFSPKR